jgi:phosphatidylglycerol---prolipoprotein diacylglyceryl transferase
MYPTLARLGPFEVPAHATFILLGVIAAALVFRHEARRRGVAGDERLLWIVAGTLAAGALGAKLSTAWHYVAATGDVSLGGIVARGGRSILGGLTGAYVGALATKRLVGYRRHTGDLFAPAVALGMAIGRVGCFLSEPPGTPTALPWGIRLTAEQAAAIPACPAWCAAGAPLHPSFVYEILFHLAAFAALWWWLRRRPHAEGALFKQYLLAYALFRFLVEFVRGNEVAWLGLTRAQLFLVPATALLASYFLRRRETPPPTAPSPTIA